MVISTQDPGKIAIPIVAIGDESAPIQLAQCVVEICERKTYRHTDRHRDTLIAILRSRSSNCESEYECGRECNMALL